MALGWDTVAKSIMIIWNDWLSHFHVSP
jgi:hypothetical protein